jgi:hypothetical protein
MKFSEVKLPSNKKFGYFFTFVFVVAAAFFCLSSSMIAVNVFSFMASVFFVVTFVNADLLLPLNKLWMRFGLLLGMIVSPIVLGVIYFGMFTPIACVMRLNRRDELRLKFKRKGTHWISRDETIQVESFKHQF